MDPLQTRADILRACETDHEYWHDAVFVWYDGVLTLETQWRNERELAGTWIIPYPLASEDIFWDLVMDGKVRRIDSSVEKAYEFVPGALSALKKVTS
jgi:hypothetical protein